MAQREAHEIADIEVVAHLFAMARSERYTQLKPMFEQALKDLPQISRERMLSCCDQLATKLRDADYEGFASEFSGRLTKKKLEEKKRLRQELLEPGL